KLTAADGAANATFGAAVALEGTTALVGAPFTTVNGNAGQGAVYEFDQSGGSWTQTQELAADDGATYDEFGSAIGLEGSTALIGAPGADVNGDAGEGAVYVFGRSDGDWSQLQQFSPDAGTADEVFGWQISLVGANALIGAPGITFTTDNPGAAYLFTESGGVWAQSRKFAASDGAPADNFGWAVGFTVGTALVGSYHAAVDGNFEEGAAYFYGAADLGLNLSAPEAVGQGQNYVSQTIATNNASAASPAVSATITVPAAASFVSASASQGSCSEDSGVVSCDFGAIEGNAGTATANVTLKATGNVGDTIENTASVAKATPALSASAATEITGSESCPDGYTSYSGTLAP
ncbi:MAG TPA: FG-GAP repeat protein, partial [Thermomicrobiales bacterium]|nr:FG-GAP repeat protein [Thermomicrobiales bacterium]